MRAYFFGIHSGTIPKIWRYERYLANYYDPTDPAGMFREIVENALPEGVELTDIGTICEDKLDNDELERVRKHMLDIMERREIRDTRTQEQKEDLAGTDARLLLTTLNVNTRNLADPSSRPLWATCYIVTNSTRYIQTASGLNLRNVVSAKPRHLMSIVERLSGPVVSDKAVVRLFESPLLVASVNEMWGDIEGLLGNGIQLVGKSLVRRRRDLDIALHEALGPSNAADAADEEDTEEDRPDPYVQLVARAESLD